jgi:hypothetical protein
VSSLVGGWSMARMHTFDEACLLIHRRFDFKQQFQRFAQCLRLLFPSNI